MSAKTAKAVFEDLKKKYGDDTEIMQDIAFYEKDLEYMLNKEKQPNYTGQTALEWAKSIAEEIKYWN